MLSLSKPWKNQTQVPSEAATYTSGLRDAPQGKLLEQCTVHCERNHEIDKETGDNEEEMAEKKNENKGNKNA